MAGTMPPHFLFNSLFNTFQMLGIPGISCTCGSVPELPSQCKKFTRSSLLYTNSIRGLNWSALLFFFSFSGRWGAPTEILPSLAVPYSFMSALQWAPHDF
jgi:hypothetical protein